MARESACRRRNPPRSWKDATAHWLKEGDYYRIPWIRKFVPRLEAATGDAEIRALKKELERFFAVLETGGELERDEVQDINRALLMGTLSVGQSGRAIPETEPRAPEQREEPVRRRRAEPRGRDRGLREPTEQEIQEALRTPDDFGYSGDLPIGETWSLGPVIRTRDSNLLDSSNADALEAALENIREFQDEYQIVHAGHWAVGWVDHLAFHAVDENREPTQIFKWILGWFDALGEYPVANDEDYSRRQHEALIKDINDAGHRMQGGHPADETGWEDSVCEWLEENGSREARRSLEDPENWGVRPEDVEQALRALGLFRADEKFSIQLVPTDDDPMMVLVSTTDRHEALEDQTIEGSQWEAPADMHEAYAIIINTADLPDRLRTEGYIVDDSEWFFPGIGAPGQEELPRMHTIDEWRERWREPAEVIASITVKGNQRAALAAARGRGFEVMRENVRVGNSDVTFYVKGSHPALAAWYAESPLAAPFPSDTLLLYRIIDDPDILRALEE